mmetsp:Transcript_12044/g.20367  ORF Transcript_12044/g.20367 Transcript_12044/m.20367 type:complete len:227 (-) Transcript_12044:24-704(-)|eukprot:CAMPEP_0198210264 /NCGR_PEP_ID=MMETSP1445-20131203/19996_1 /TAXON_ID=36898 /ORGANISM="Pyramimonas sp., Strain CCMP2087" /LENGTH=226 /DNA_ID=CAMNT_0043884283 /DNA_START=181 /DNA_END=861 /DNA_ORIENTATION=+
MVAEMEDPVDYSEVLNADALDLERMLTELRDTGLCAVEGIIKEPFRQKLCSEADEHFSTVPTAEIEVIGPYEVKQQFNAKADLAHDSNYGILRRAFQKLLLEKLGHSRAESTFTAEPLNFNYFELMQYPAGSVGISPHRDHAENINIVCVFTIGGRGFVYGCEDRAGTKPTRYNTFPGAVILMRAPGFENYKAKDRPFHYVGDIETMRYSYAVRQVRRESLPPGQP